LINNRQNGRRRGRGGQRPQNIGGQSGGGNRQDSRQRGNAAQLLEKYKSLARDAQLAGDRVQTEYYLQYADHYFRVLGESRARFDEQRRQRGDDSDDDENDDEMMDSDESSDHGDQDDDRPVRRERNDRPERAQRAERPERSRRPVRDQQRQTSSDNDESTGNERIPFDVLPPSIGINADESSDNDEATEARPRRRTRRPRADDNDSEIAPAA
jgi:Domain of unknown function (DUF4167)